MLVLILVRNSAAAAKKASSAFPSRELASLDPSLSPSSRSLSVPRIPYPSKARSVAREVSWRKALEGCLTFHLLAPSREGLKGLSNRTVSTDCERHASSLDDEINLGRYGH